MLKQLIFKKGQSWRILWILAIMGFSAVLAAGFSAYAYLIMQYSVPPRIQPFMQAFVDLIIGFFAMSVAVSAWCLASILRGIRSKAASRKRDTFLLVVGMVDALAGVALAILVLVIIQEQARVLAGDFLDAVILAGIAIPGFGACLAIGGLELIVSWHRRKEITQLGRAMIAINIVLLVCGGVEAGLYAFAPPVACLSFPADFPYKIDLFAQGDNDYNTFKIPALLMTPNGTILAFCEGRHGSASDFADTDLMLRKSYDNGTTWTSLKALIDVGTFTIGNPCPVVDKQTGTIWLSFCQNNDRVFIINSTDNGETWSSPRELTTVVKESGWTWYATGPTHGIQMHGGRLVIPCDHIIGGQYYSHVIYSDDHGKTWNIGGGVAGGDECTVVEAESGSLYLNMREAGPGNKRLFSWSNDGGITWSGARQDPVLIEPVCQGSLLRLTNTTSFHASRVLFSNPHSVYRENVSVMISYDDCKSWKTTRVLYPGLSSYSDLATTRDSSLIFCMFEHGCDFYAEQIVFTRFTLTWLTNGSDAIDPLP